MSDSEAAQEVGIILCYGYIDQGRAPIEYEGYRAYLERSVQLLSAIEQCQMVIISGGETISGRGTEAFSASPSIKNLFAALNQTPTVLIEETGRDTASNLRGCKAKLESMGMMRAEVVICCDALWVAEVLVVASQLFDRYSILGSWREDIHHHHSYDFRFAKAIAIHNAMAAQSESVTPPST